MGNTLAMLFFPNWWWELNPWIFYRVTGKHASHFPTGGWELNPWNFKRVDGKHASHVVFPQLVLGIEPLEFLEGNWETRQPCCFSQLVVGIEPLEFLEGQ